METRDLRPGLFVVQKDGTPQSVGGQGRVLVLIVEDGKVNMQAFVDGAFQSSMRPTADREELSSWIEVHLDSLLEQGPYVDPEKHALKIRPGAG